jgi:hypothetical protein
VRGNGIWIIWLHESVRKHDSWRQVAAPDVFIRLQLLTITSLIHCFVAFFGKCKEQWISSQNYWTICWGADAPGCYHVIMACMTQTICIMMHQWSLPLPCCICSSTLPYNLLVSVAMLDQIQVMISICQGTHWNVGIIINQIRINRIGLIQHYMQ